MRVTFPMVYSASLFAAAFVGFSYNFDPATRAADLFRPRFVAHGLACLGWLSLLLAQTTLVGAGNTRAHRRLGMAGPFVASAVVLTSGFVAVASLVETGWVRLVTYGNLAAVLVFGVFVVLGYRARADRESHRRLLLVGTLFMMGPVYTRLGGIIHPVAFLVAHLVGWAALIVYDRSSHGKVDRAVWAGIGLLFIYMAFTAVAYDVRLGT